MEILNVAIVRAKTRDTDLKSPQEVMQQKI